MVQTLPNHHSQSFLAIPKADTSTCLTALVCYSMHLISIRANRDWISNPQQGYHLTVPIKHVETCGKDSPSADLASDTDLAGIWQESGILGQNIPSFKRLFYPSEVGEQVNCNVFNWHVCC